MENRYIAFDVETPNHANDRMSAIGIAVANSREILAEYDFLVDPQEPFDPFNVALTGISPDMVRGQPTFAQLWPTIAPILESGLLVAHNAPFDMAVLAKCLRHYGIRWHSCVLYACTCQMSRRLLPHLPNHRLDTLCTYLNVDLDHHRAGSDSRACGEILLHHLRSGAQTAPFIRIYDLDHIRTVKAPPISRGR